MLDKGNTVKCIKRKTFSVTPWLADGKHTASGPPALCYV